jgi:hypothetical protein
MHSEHHMTAIGWRDRAVAAGKHLAISLLIAALAALLVFGVWYPYPYREMSSGRELFLLIVTVDVILGPLITFTVFNRSKSRREIMMDLSVVAVLQLAALAYGLWTVAMARPVHLVFEIDRFRVVHRIEVADELLPRAPAGVGVIPMTGPTMLAVRSLKDSKESFDLTVAALAGVELSHRPDMWQPYVDARRRVLAAAKPVSELKARFPQQGAAIDGALNGARVDAATARYLPVVGRKTFWTAFVDPNAAVVAFIPLDSF